VSKSPGWRRYLGVSYDHKVIGIQYAVTSLVLLVVGGLFALIFRVSWPNRACSCFLSSSTP
jgi:cytochrome c oxidase subunit I